MSRGLSAIHIAGKSELSKIPCYTVPVSQKEHTVRRLFASILYRAILMTTLAGAVLSATAQVQPTLSPELRQKIDHAAGNVLTKTGVPSASVAIVKDGHI